MRAWWALVVVVAGCDEVYGLGGRTEPDARIDARPDAAEPCPSDEAYLPIADTDPNSRYRIVETNRVTWKAAFDDCRDDTQTGVTHLIVFDDTTELTFVRDASPTRDNSTWIAWGGYARNISGEPFQFTSVTGDPIARTSTLWAQFEPDDGGPGTHETAVWWGNNLSGLIDGPWDYNGPEGYICECDGRPTIGIDFDLGPPSM